MQTRAVQRVARSRCQHPKSTVMGIEARHSSASDAPLGDLYMIEAYQD